VGGGGGCGRLESKGKGPGGKKVPSSQPFATPKKMIVSRDRLLKGRKKELSERVDETKGDLKLPGVPGKKGRKGLKVYLTILILGGGGVKKKKKETI